MWLRRTVRQLRSGSSLMQHCGRRPFHAKHISNSNYGSPQTVRQAGQTSRRVLESSPCSPCRGSMSHPTPPSVQLLSLNVNGLRETQQRAALFAVLQTELWHVIALQEIHHGSQAEAAQLCREGAGPSCGLIALSSCQGRCSTHLRFVSDLC